MKAKLQHIFLNVSNPDVSFPFYVEFLSLLGYIIEFEDGNQIGLNNGNNEIWLRKSSDSTPFNRNSVGINHIAFRVEKNSDVDLFYNSFILKNEKQTLYNSPRIFPDFTDDYYAVYFEDPDGIKIEVTCYTFDLEALKHDKK